MAKEAIRLPPDIIRAIEKIVSRGQTANVKLDRGVLKVQRMAIDLEAAMKI